MIAAFSVSAAAMACNEHRAPGVAAISNDDPGENEDIGGRRAPGFPGTTTLIKSTAATVRGEIRGLDHEVFSAAVAAVAPGPRPFTLTPSPVFSFNTSTASGARIDIGGWPADSTIAVSSTHVCLTSRAAFACYTKAGALVSLGNGFGAVPVTAKAFFDGSGIQPPIIAWDGPGDTNYTKDGRIVFDPVTKRFYVVFQSREATGRLLIAASKSEDPRDGWWTYANVDGDASRPAHDYQFLGVNSGYLLPSEDLVTAWSGGAFAGTIHLMYPTAELANGTFTGSSRLAWETSPADSAVPCVHDTSTPDAFWVHRDDASHATVWAVHNGAVIKGPSTPIQFSDQIFNSVQKSGNGTAPIIFSVNGNGPKMAEYRNGIITWVSEDKIQAADLSWHGGIHLVQMNVSSLISSNQVSIVKDRIFGLSGASDPPGSVFDYGMPAVSTNSLADVVVGEIRTNATIFPDQRVSVWPAGASDIDSSISSGAGTATLAPQTYHMGGAASDPTTSSVYLSQMLPITGSVPWVIRVNKMLGATQPDLYPQGIVAPATVTHGVAFSVQVQIVNQGDGSAPASFTDLWDCWGKNFITGGLGTQQSWLAEVAIPALAPGAGFTATVSVTIPDPGSYFLALDVDTTQAVSESSETNNRNPILASPHGNVPITVQ